MRHFRSMCRQSGFVSDSLWRRKPDVLPFRPVNPGASIFDARFLVDGSPPNYPIVPQPLAALDLLDYPDQVARHTGATC
jgi:hypothetical protein